ncbi:MAG: hypothetical protein NTZ50_03595 [Chloroflexi bacterium]|nr:hypothetical protein [Chloroflexota bacterium]
MNYINTIKRAFRIAWTHKSLWLLGFLAALSGGGGGGGNLNIPSNQRNTDTLPGWMDNSELSNQVARWFDQNSGLVLAAICGLLCVLLVLWIVTLILSEIGHGGLIANVDRIEHGENPGFGDGWRAGSARLRTLVGLRLLLAIPGILLGLIFAAILVIGVVGIAGSTGTRSSESMFTTMMGAGLVGILCVGIPLLCIFVIYGILVGILETFGRRAIMINGLGAVDGLKRGWAVFRSRIGDSIVLAILMAVVGFVIGLIIAVPLLIFGVSTVATAVMSDQMSTIPWALIAVGILTTIVIAIVLGSFITAVDSTLWTLAYREFTTPPPPPPPPPVLTSTTDAGQPMIEAGQSPTADAPSAESAP